MKKLILTIATAALLFGCAGTNNTSPSASGGSSGYTEIKTPTAELQAIKKEMEVSNIPCGVGIGESNDEMIAMTMAEDEGRKALATSMMTMVTRLSEQYAQNVGKEAKKIWEEKTNQLTMAELSGTTAYKSVTLYDNSTSTYKIYTLMVMNPNLFKKAIEDAAKDQEEMELRVKSADMQGRLDDAVKAYQERYNK